MRTTISKTAAGTALAAALTVGLLSGAAPAEASPHVWAPGGNGNGGGGGGNNTGGNGGATGGNTTSNGNPKSGAANGGGGATATGNNDAPGNGTVKQDSGPTAIGGWNGNGQGNVDPAWIPGTPPGSNPFGPPGQVMNAATIKLASGLVLDPNPFFGVPPGQWGAVTLDPAVLTVRVPDSGGALGALQNLTWNDALSAWGVTRADGTFVAFPVSLPAPPAPTELPVPEETPAPAS